MSLYHLLQQRAAAGRPVRVGLIGAGKFGSMFLNQAPAMPGVEVVVIADLDPERARTACQNVGWDAARIARTAFVASGAEACADPGVEVIVEATGSPLAGIVHARAPPASTSSWSMSKPMCWLDRCLPRRRGYGVSSIRSPM